MRLTQYINEDIDKIFIRLGSMSGQKQKHRGNKRAPAKKGIWLLPVQAGKSDLAFLGGYIQKNDRLHVKDFEKEYGISQKEYDDLSYLEMNKLDNKVANKKIKKHYKTLKLKPTDIVWTHMKKGKPDIDFDTGWPWYKVSVREYWKLFKKTFGSEIKQGFSFDGEWAEIFWETT